MRGGLRKPVNRCNFFMGFGAALGLRIILMIASRLKMCVAYNFVYKRDKNKRFSSEQKKHLTDN